MNKVVKGLLSTSSMVVGTIVGGLSGLLYIFLDGLKCLDVNVPRVRPTTNISIDFSNVNLDGVISFPTGVNEQLLKQRLDQVDIQADINVPTIVPHIEFSECLTPLYAGLAVGAGVTLAGLAGFHLYSSRNNNRYQVFTDEQIDQEVEMSRLATIDMS